MVQAGDERGDAPVACPRLDRQRALAGGGQHDVQLEHEGGEAGASQAREAGGGQHGAVETLVGELAQARLDVAAQVDEPQVRPQAEELRAPPEA